MKTKEDLKAMLEDEKAVRFLAKRFLAKGEYEKVEKSCGFPEGSFDELFTENSALEIIFQGAVVEEAEKERSIKSSYQVGKTIDRLFNITEDIEEEAKTVNQAAGIILNYYSKLNNVKAKSQDDEEDELMSLYKKVSQEKEQEKNGK